MEIVFKKKPTLTLTREPFNSSQAIQALWGVM